MLNFQNRRHFAVRRVDCVNESVQLGQVASFKNPLTKCEYFLKINR